MLANTSSLLSLLNSLLSFFLSFFFRVYKYTSSCSCSHFFLSVFSFLWHLYGLCFLGLYGVAIIMLCRLRFLLCRKCVFMGLQFSKWWDHGILCILCCKHSHPFFFYLGIFHTLYTVWYCLWLLHYVFQLSLHWHPYNICLLDPVMVSIATFSEISLSYMIKSFVCILHSFSYLLKGCFPCTRNNHIFMLFCSLPKYSPIVSSFWWIDVNTNLPTQLVVFVAFKHLEYIFIYVVLLGRSMWIFLLFPELSVLSSLEFTSFNCSSMLKKEDIKSNHTLKISCLFSLDQANVGNGIFEVATFIFSLFLLLLK